MPTTAEAPVLHNYVGYDELLYGTRQVVASSGSATLLDIESRRIHDLVTEETNKQLAQIGVLN
jgi:hypothetical protein